MLTICTRAATFGRTPTEFDTEKASAAGRSIQKWAAQCANTGRHSKDELAMSLSRDIARISLPDSIIGIARAPQQSFSVRTTQAA